MKTKEETEQLVREYLGRHPGKVRGLARAYREGDVKGVCWLTEFLVGAILWKKPDYSKGMTRGCLTRELIEELEVRK